MQSEQPHGLFWRLRSNPRWWATVIPLVTLVLAVLVTLQLLLPVLPRGLRKAFEAADEQADSRALHVAERIAVKAELRRLAVAAQERSIDYETCEAAVQHIRDLLIEEIRIREFGQTFLAHVSFSDDERTAAENTLCRYAVALLHGKVNEDTGLAIEERTVQVDAEGKRRSRMALPDDEFRDLLIAMTAAADEAGIPETVEPLDISARVRQIVDEALAQP